VAGGSALLLDRAGALRARTGEVTALKEKLLALIRASGPISVGQYMQIALSDPEHGYYMRSDPLGRDFITAPEVSQMFGEMIGLFLVQSWHEQGRPNLFRLVELGPGRGTLMADILRSAAKVEPEFPPAAEIVLVETSPALRTVQASTLSHLSVRWTSGLEERKDLPLYLVANEFFDALPVRQLVKSRRGWHERMVAAEGDRLAFALTPDPLPPNMIPEHLREAAEGSVFEHSAASASLMRSIAGQIEKSGGIALLIDYGHGLSEIGDTLQAVQANRYADLLAEPGAADLTAHVDFATLREIAVDEHAAVWGPVTQGTFLGALGIGLRGQRLKQAAPDRAAEIDAALARLTEPDQMGTLFKVMAVTAADAPAPAGFPA
jgi:NADH dehydrogenase [ubiquinone] 1 alpha subcomplex assembly factor 7